MELPVVSAQVFRFGLFELDVAQNALLRSGVRVKIADQSLCVLVHLLENPGRIVTRDELRQKLWPDGTYVDFDGSLNVILKRLRGVLGDDSENPRFIETVPKRGYRFIAPVSATNAQAETKSSTQTANDTRPSDLVASATTRGRSRRSGFRYFAVAAMLVAVIGATWLYRHRRESISQALNIPLKADAHMSLRKSVAVLGFHNISGKANDEWLSTAFSEMLSTELAGGDKLRLVSGEEVANLRRSSPWPETGSLNQSTTARLGTALNSDLLILGSYTAAGQADRGQLRLDVRLQDAKTGEILTEIAQTCSREDPFQLAAAIGAKLRTRLGVPQLAEPEQASVVASLPSNREAARLYALGLNKLREFDALAAKDLLQQACNADPKFALGQAMLARAWNQLGYEQKRREEAKRALELSTSLPRTERMLVEGDYYESLADHEKAESTYRALFELFPDNVDYGLQLASVQNAAGHASQALATLAQLRRLPAPGSDDPRIDLLASRTGPVNKPASLQFLRSAMQKAAAQGKKLVYARAKEDECNNMVYGGHPDQLSACDEAYNIFMAAGNRLQAADTIRLIGDSQGTQGHPLQAITTYQRALNIVRELGEHAVTGVILDNMADDFAAEGNFKHAEQLYRQAKMHFEQAGNKLNTITAVANLADMRYLQGDLPGAAKLYHQALDLDASVDPSQPEYQLYRLGDLELAQGRVEDAHRLVQQAVDLSRSHPGEDASGAIDELGDALKAEGDLQGARQQYKAALDIQQRIGERGPAGETQEAMADLALQEGQADQAEGLLREAIPEFEKEKARPDAARAYIVLSRALLFQGKTDESRKAIQQAADLCRTSPDPALKLPAEIQTARVEMAEAVSNPASAAVLTRARQRLQSAVATAHRLGYYMLECEARLVLGELALKSAPASGRAHLAALAAEARSHGLELLARHAEQAITSPGSVVAANLPAR